VADQEPRWGVASLSRRRHPRLDVSLPVEFVVRGPEPAGGPAAAPGRTGNVGGGGLLLIVPQPLPVGTSIGLTLYLPAGPLAGRGEPRPVTAEAMVVWTDLSTEGSQEMRCGVGFTSIADEGRAAIVDFVTRGRSV